MSDDQTLTILQAISDARKESADAIGKLATSVAEFHGSIGARVDAVESEVASQKKWSRINTALMPVYALLHAVSAHLGIKT